jgi:subtilisin family serine protease
MSRESASTREFFSLNETANDFSLAAKADRFVPTDTYTVLNLSADRSTLTPNGQSVYDEVLVQFRPGVAAQTQRSVLAAVGATVGYVVRSDADGDLLVIHLQGQSADAIIAALSRNPNVTFAEPNYSVQVEAINDPLFQNGSTWGLYGDQSTPANQFGSQAAEVWVTQTGSMKTVVGIIDTGVDYTHPDLYLNIWLNPGEIPATLGVVDTDSDGLITFRDLNRSANAAAVSDINGNGRIDAGDLLNDARWENGRDEDGNGRIDDLIGWDFVNNDNDPFDGNRHGTHVAGTIGGMGNNGLGVIGVNWNVQIMALKFLSDSGSGSTAGAIMAVDYYTRATEIYDSGPGNYVGTNNSWGGGGYSQGLLDSIVKGARADVLFIAAAGNSNSNNDAVASYPSNYSTLAAAGWDAVVAVAAIAQDGTRASFTSYGKTTVDLAAPGVGIVSTVPGGGYASLSGTSMATPHVTGAVALLASANEALSGQLLRSFLLTTAEPTASVATITATGGRLDVGDMIAAGVAGGATVPPPPPSPTKIYGTSGSDVLRGTTGNDIIYGVPATGSQIGRGTIDRLTGGGGDDIFVLGDVRGRFYDDGRGSNAGLSDYALITDFSAGDKIQIVAGTYFLTPYNGGGITGTGLYHDSNGSRSLDGRDELIAIIQGIVPAPADFLTFA